MAQAGRDNEIRVCSENNLHGLLHANVLSHIVTVTFDFAFERGYVLDVVVKGARETAARKPRRHPWIANATEVVPNLSRCIDKGYRNNAPLCTCEALLRDILCDFGLAQQCDSLKRSIFFC